METPNLDTDLAIAHLDQLRQMLLPKEQPKKKKKVVSDEQLAKVRANWAKRQERRK